MCATSTSDATDLAAFHGLPFEGYLATVEAALHELGVAGILSSPRDVARLEDLYDAGTDLDCLLQAMMEGVERKLSRGKEVRRFSDLLPTIRAALRRAVEP